MHLTANISIPQKNFIAIDLHSDNAVICVRRNALNKAGELVGKNIWCGRVSIRDGLDNFIKVLVPHSQDFDHVAVVESTYNWYCLADAIGASISGSEGCSAPRSDVVMKSHSLAACKKQILSLQTPAIPVLTKILPASWT